MSTKLMLLILVSVFVTACSNVKEPSETELAMKQELEELKEEKRQAKLEQEQIELEAAQAEERAELQEVIDALNKKIKEVEAMGPTTIPAPVSTPTPKKPVVGPGDANFANGPTNGTVRVQTKSAKGSLTLRTNPGTNNPAVLDDNSNLVTIPNGSVIEYTSYHDMGLFTWYKVNYPEGGGNYTGWVRGDYLIRL